MSNEFNAWKATTRLYAHLAGEDPNPDEAIASWAQFEIHQAAMHILDLPKQEREAFLRRLPSYLHEQVKLEVNRVWAWRRAQRRQE